MFHVCAFMLFFCSCAVAIQPRACCDPATFGGVNRKREGPNGPERSALVTIRQWWKELQSRGRANPQMFANVWKKPLADG